MSLLLWFFLEVALQAMVKNNPTEKQIDTKTEAALKHAPAWKLTEEEMQSLSLQITRVDLHHKLQLLIRICFLLDYLLLFLRFVLLTLSMCLFAGKNLEQNPLLFLS